MNFIIEIRSVNGNHETMIKSLISDADNKANAIERALLGQAYDDLDWEEGRESAYDLNGEIYLEACDAKEIDDDLYNLLSDHM